MRLRNPTMTLLEKVREKEDDKEEVGAEVGES